MQHTILLCGGSGQRLWPLSGTIRSKMFLNLLPAPGGGTESMIGRVCRQLGQAGLGESALFVTHKDQRALVRRYTGGGYPVIGEPHKRGTFTAAALGVLHLYALGTAKPEDTICVAPADMFADDDFFRLFHQFTDVLSASGAELVLLGTRPAHPSDQYGYIVPGTRGAGAYAPVLSFEEKPGSARAEELISASALWNCGVFAFRLSFMLSQLQQMGLPAELTAFRDCYPGLPVLSFDKEVAERSSNAVVLRHEGEWRDLGSWAALSTELQHPVTGEGGIWGDSPDSVIINELNIPLHVIGVPGIIAAAGPEGILVAGKHEANAIKTIVQQHLSAPRYGECSWGSYTILDRTTSGPQQILTIKLSLLPDQELPETTSHFRKHWLILSGHGETLRNGLYTAARTGDSFTIGRDEQHGIRARTAMELIELRVSDDTGEESIYS
ncbi:MULTISPECIES: sugar phosphate nucleotidyltransferase [unclassified Paenibacillus]|uniref:sugar phosphate nucleotidyltransferase n=1 Tax=unclassified Paenibacillus TaxID=185978 RepID=UPI0024050FEE|nr:MULTISPECIES: sugar phosphate nucleotidyltransferase [unclassified Paenibacillus]MDF9844346.1 mannose-1-phosphate guanylyltransferase [Paenibacillus sp. PastF-2]MDF9850950.1 mannose-1-phosphate guanylyltransferase [Paenibacillus sp. PastM-2]MDF9857521.1 mannose-1-phosphate guanylyltransferase [Paenibacillus sp. PastF-1]MDH6482838.1 mannose-1-phosphate guanylyltransferase [Paenibacillus sp. PastH-2]MDH6510263.1 mannose-1-phosphate guanylyltransferase [Paenibacillus sp. PastM-3]